MLSKPRYFRAVNTLAIWVCAFAPGITLAQKPANPPPLIAPLLPGAAQPTVGDEGKRVAKLELEQLNALLVQITKDRAEAQPNQQELEALLKQVQTRVAGSTPTTVAAAPTKFTGASPLPVSGSAGEILLALKAMQANQASLLDGRLTTKMGEVTQQHRSDTATRVNDAKQREAELGALRSALQDLQQIYSTLDAPQIKRMPQLAGPMFATMLQARQREINSSLAAGGYANGLPSLKGSRFGPNLQPDTTHTQIQNAIAELKLSIDKLGATTQANASNLHATTANHAEFLDTMTKLINQLNENRSAIVSNPR